MKSVRNVGRHENDFSSLENDLNSPYFQLQMTVNQLNQSVKRRRVLGESLPAIKRKKGYGSS